MPFSLERIDSLTWPKLIHSRRTKKPVASQHCLYGDPTGLGYVVLGQNRSVDFHLIKLYNIVHVRSIYLNGGTFGGRYFA